MRSRRYFNAVQIHLTWLPESANSMVVLPLISSFFVSCLRKSFQVLRAFHDRRRDQSYDEDKESREGRCGSIIKRLGLLFEQITCLVVRVCMFEMERKGDFCEL